MRLNELSKVEYVQDMPDYDLEEGVFYLSQSWELGIHLCPCGCKGEAVTPLNRGTGWEYAIQEGKITLRPSLHNKYPCQSHYFIVDNKILWT